MTIMTVMALNIEVTLLVVVVVSDDAAGSCRA
jgi:hypothetical protein